MITTPTKGKAAFTTAITALNALGATVTDTEWSDDLDTGRFIVPASDDTCWVFTVDGDRIHGLRNEYDPQGEFRFNPEDFMSIEIVNPGPPTLARVLLALI